MSEGAEVDQTTAELVHFGYDGEQVYNSPVLDGADPKAQDPANWLPDSLVNESQRALAAGDSFICTLWVGQVVAHTTGSDKGGTSQDCTGSFRTQWTNGQFATDNGGWHRVTGSIVGPRTSKQNNDTTFYVNCKSPVPSDRKHRLEARGYAIAKDGTEVRGDLLYGKAKSRRCL
ncbi:hypothetical protein AB0I77_24355 [Streptomyces sp. NPDC050619]|uniref:hypothetical protein n=1 Tax=Streptomyces sp. NPDC050619 TaxID=3157214 RepID=UPI003440E64D